MDNGINELAMLFKERDNVSFMGIQVGKVIQPLPNLQISIGDNIILDNDDLYVSWMIMDDYQREVDVEGTINIQGHININGVETTSVNDGGDGASSHSHQVPISSKSMTQSNNTFQLKGTQVNHSYLVPGDLVMVMPTQDEQTYFVIDKVVKL